MNVDLTNPELTPNEQAAIDQGLADDEAARTAAAAPVPEAPPAPEPAAPAAAVPADDGSTAISAAADRLAAAAEALAAATPAPAVAVEPAAAAPVVRDFDAEHDALAKKLDDGDLEPAEHAQALRKLTLEEADARTEERLAKARQEDALALQQRNEQSAEEAWAAAQQTFFTDPGNAALVANPIAKAGFEAAVGMVFQEAGGMLPWDEVLVKAREKVTGVAAVPAADPAVAIAQAVKDRATTPAPSSIRDAPIAGNPIDAAPGAGLDNLDISDLEDKLAMMTEAQRAEYRSAAPGGLNDNPRG